MMTARAAASPPVKPWFRSGRFWVSIATAVVVAIIVWGAWPQMMDAVASLSRVNPAVLALVVPVQLASFAATGEVLFAFLRSRGDISRVGPVAAMRMSLEFNFANHMLPSAGAAGLAYTSWKLRTLGVPASRGTLAQLVRFGVTFASFVLLLLTAAVFLIISGQGSPEILLLAVLIGALAVGALIGSALLLRRRRTLHGFARALAAALRHAAAVVRRPSPIDSVALVRFFDGLHLEYREAVRRPRGLVAPFLWSFLVHALDAGILWVGLAAFGIIVDPALLFVAYGMATLASIVILTPNGVGGYEVILVATLFAGGVSGGAVIAAIVVVRVVQMLGTIAFGWGFYQHSVATAGAPAVRTKQDSE